MVKIKMHYRMKINANRTCVEGCTTETNRPSFFAVGGCVSLYCGLKGATINCRWRFLPHYYPSPLLEEVDHLYLTWRWSASVMHLAIPNGERRGFTAPHRLHVFSCTAQRTEIAPALVLNLLLLFQLGALSQTTDVVLQSEAKAPAAWETRSVWLY